MINKRLCDPFGLYKLLHHWCYKHQNPPDSKRICTFIMIDTITRPVDGGLNNPRCSQSPQNASMAGWYASMAAYKDSMAGYLFSTRVYLFSTTGHTASMAALAASMAGYHGTTAAYRSSMGAYLFSTTAYNATMAVYRVATGIYIVAMQPLDELWLHRTTYSDKFFQKMTLPQKPVTPP